ncbi:MAG TPA: bifunctional methylenetetrahydrofolate dehydrogenase/methenyltetrahydrofolate cyclohydrolase FolD [Gemmatimonadales bacterium]|nr:bifunctional methylenetetrahydrofolate dehydrogenase/methenyltetrahydrofolate cyclohydrolase FolD [Gemmatimonadales bacterium]
MSARIIDGVALGKTIRQEVAKEIETLKARGVVPGLAVVLVGENPASRAYVASKEKACLEAGMHSVKVTRDASIPESELLAIVDQLNRDPAVHGILVQLPLPKHINTEKVLLRVDPLKDVDGFHPMNVGKLVIGDPTALRPCTPWGVVQMLVRNGIETKGAHAVVLGRSTIVGKPMANLLIQQGTGGDATVTVCHSRTRDLPAVCRSADILIAAIGKPEFVRHDFVKPGAVVIDVGINRVDDSSLPKGYRLTGDVAYAECAEVASAITPVPGGVGPMTIAMLMANTLQAMKQTQRA